MVSNININLEDLANGAVKEKLSHALAEVANNIMDQNTDATKARKVTLVISMKPDEMREVISTTVDVKTTLTPEVGVGTTLLVGKDKGQPVINELKSGIRGQEYIDDNGELRHDTGELVDEDKKSDPIDFRKAKNAKEAK